MTGRLPSEVEEALWEGVARGLVTADGFRAVRSLLRRGSRTGAPAATRPAARPGRRRRRLGRAVVAAAQPGSRR